MKHAHGQTAISSLDFHAFVLTHLHVDKVPHVQQGKIEQKTNQMDISLLNRQVQHGLVAFDFLELVNWKQSQQNTPKNNNITTLKKT